MLNWPVISRYPRMTWIKIKERRTPMAACRSRTHGAVVIFLGRDLWAFAPHPLRPAAPCPSPSRSAPPSSSSGSAPRLASAPARASSRGRRRGMWSTLSRRRTAPAGEGTWSSTWAWTRRDTRPWLRLRGSERERGHAEHVNKPCGGTSASRSSTQERFLTSDRVTHQGLDFYIHCWKGKHKSRNRDQVNPFFHANRCGKKCDIPQMYCTSSFCGELRLISYSKPLAVTGISLTPPQLTCRRNSSERVLHANTLTTHFLKRNTDQELSLYNSTYASSLLIPARFINLSLISVEQSKQSMYLHLWLKVFTPSEQKVP